MEIRRYKRGDLVRVWSLQSFYGGGFLDGVPAIVRQDQTGKSVLLIVNRKPVLDTSYEVFIQQTELIREATSDDKQMVEEFLELNQKIRTNENDTRLNRQN